MIGNLIPFIFFVCIYVFCDKNNSRGLRLFIVASIISLVTIIIVGSATGLFVLLIQLAFTVIYTILKKTKIPYRLAIGVYCAFFILVIVLNSNSYIITFVSQILGRSGTFTGRSTLWAKAIEEIAQRPLFGYGYSGGNINIWSGTYSSHNMFLEMMIQGGVFYLALFVFVTFVAIKRLRKASVALGNSIFLGLYCFLLKGLMETELSEIYFILLIFAYYSKKIDVQFQNYKYLYMNRKD